MSSVLRTTLLLSPTALLLGIGLYYQPVAVGLCVGTIIAGTGLAGFLVTWVQSGE